MTRAPRHGPSPADRPAPAEAIPKLPANRKLLDAATEALTAVLRFDQPADGILSRYFREHHGLGQHDRAFVAESVFGVLRHKRTLDHFTGNANPRRLLLAWITRYAGVSVRDLAAGLGPAEA